MSLRFVLTCLLNYGVHVTHLIQHIIMLILIYMYMCLVISKGNTQSLFYNTFESIHRVIY